MFGLEEAEVMQRRRYVEHVREVIEVRGAYSILAVHSRILIML